MFRNTPKHKQVDLFSGVSTILEGKSLSGYKDECGWHNQFRKQIISRLDESVFKVLYSKKMGAPNASISVMVGMMILKEAFGWSDAQLFENCRYNLLVRSALGLFNLSDEIPAESTYYLLRRHVHTYEREHGENLLERVFESVTRDQIKEFEVSGEQIRMDSKLLGSNIAWYSRYEIIHQTLVLFYKKMSKTQYRLLSDQEKQELESLVTEEAQKTVYRSTKQDIQTRLKTIGSLIYKLLQLYTGSEIEAYKLLKRVFEEQYEVVDQNAELRSREKIESGSVQSPHDPDSSYRNKAGQKVKGYSLNVTETTSDESLDLITNIQLEKANVADTHFVEPAIRSTEELTGSRVKKVYADGAYQSPDNDDFCKNIDMVFTGMQGAASRYDLLLTSPEGLWVTDTKTGNCLLARKVKKLKNSKEDRWVIGHGKDSIYFGQQAIRASYLRRIMKKRPIEELQKRNNVEATIFHMGCLLRNGKSKYRSLFKNNIWAICRAFWVNLIRIINYVTKLLDNTLKKSANRVSTIIFQLITELINALNQFLRQNMHELAEMIHFSAFNQKSKTYF